MRAASLIEQVPRRPGAAGAAWPHGSSNGRCAAVLRQRNSADRARHRARHPAARTRAAPGPGATYRALARRAATDRRAHRPRRSRQRRAPEDVVVIVRRSPIPALSDVRCIQRSPTTSSASRAGRHSGRRRASRCEHVEVDAGDVAGRVGSRAAPRAQRGRRVRRRRRSVGPWRWCATASRGRLRRRSRRSSRQVAAGERLLRARPGRERRPRSVHAEAMAETLARQRYRRRRRAVDGRRRSRSDRRAPWSPRSWDGASVTLGWAGDSRAYWVDRRRRPAPDRRPLMGPGPGRRRRDDRCGGRSGSPGPRDHTLARRRRAPTVAETATWTPGGAGRLVLCTDGLWNVLDGPERAGPTARVLPTSSRRWRSPSASCRRRSAGAATTTSRSP